MSRPRDSLASLSAQLRRSNNGDENLNDKPSLSNYNIRNPPHKAVSNSSSKPSFTGLLSQLEILSESNLEKKNVAPTTTPSKKVSPKQNATPQTTPKQNPATPSLTKQKSANPDADKWEELQNLIPNTRGSSKANLSVALNSKLTKSQLKSLSEKIKGNQKRLDASDEIITGNAISPQKHASENKHAPEEEQTSNLLSSFSEKLGPTKSSNLDSKLPGNSSIPGEMYDSEFIDTHNDQEIPNLIDNSFQKSDNQPSPEKKRSLHSQHSNDYDGSKKILPMSKNVSRSSSSLSHDVSQELQHQETPFSDKIISGKSHSLSSNNDNLKPMLKSSYVNPKKSTNDRSELHAQSDNSNSDSLHSISLPQLKRVQSTASSNTESQSTSNTNPSLNSFHRSSKSASNTASLYGLPTLEKIISAVSANGSTASSRDSYETQSNTQSHQQIPPELSKNDFPVPDVQSPTSHAPSYPLSSAETDGSSQTPPDAANNATIPLVSKNKSLAAIEEIIKPMETENKTVATSSDVDSKEKRKMFSGSRHPNNAELSSSKQLESSKQQSTAKLNGITYSKNVTSNNTVYNGESSVADGKSTEDDKSPISEVPLMPMISVTSATSVDEDRAFLEAFAVENARRQAMSDYSYLRSKSITVGECKNYVICSDKNIPPTLNAIAKLLSYVARAALDLTTKELSFPNKLKTDVKSRMSGKNVPVDEFSLFTIQDASEKTLEKLITTALNDSEHFMLLDDTTYQQRRMEMVEHCSDVIANYSCLKRLSNERISFVNVFLVEIQKKYPNNDLVKQNGDNSTFSQMEMHNIVNIIKKVETLTNEYDETTKKLWESIERLILAERYVMEHLCSVIRYSYLNSIKLNKKSARQSRVHVGGSTCSNNTTVSTTSESPSNNTKSSGEYYDQVWDATDAHAPTNILIKKLLDHLKQLMQTDQSDLGVGDDASDENRDKQPLPIDEVKNLIEKYLEIVDEIHVLTTKKKVQSIEDAPSMVDRDVSTPPAIENASSAKDSNILIDIYKQVNSGCKSLSVNNDKLFSLKELGGELPLDEDYSEENLKAQVDIIISGLKNYQSETGEIVDRLVGLCKAMATASSDNEIIDQNSPLKLMEGIEKKLNDMNSELQETRDCLLEKEYQLKNHNETLENLEKVNSENLEALKERNSSLEKKWKEDNSKALGNMRVLEEEKSNALVKISELQDSTNGLQNRIGELKDNIKTLEGEKRAALESIKALEDEKSKALESTRTLEGEKNKALESIQILEEEKNKALESIQILEGEKNKALESIQILEGEKNKAFDSAKSSEEQSKSLLKTHSQSSHSQSNELLLEQKQVLIERLNEQNDELSLEIRMLKDKLTKTQEDLKKKELVNKDTDEPSGTEEQQQSKEGPENRNLLIEEYTSKIKRLEGQLFQVNAELTNAQKELESVSQRDESQINSLYSQIDILKINLSQLTDEAAGLKKHNTNIDSELEKHRTELKTCNAELKSAKEELYKFTKERDKLKKENNELKPKVSSYKKDLSKVTSENNSLSKKIGSLEKKLDDSQTKLKQTETDFNELKKSNNALKNEFTTIQNDLGNVTQMLMEQKHKNSQAMEEIDDYKAKETFLQEKIDILEQQALLQESAK